MTGNLKVIRNEAAPGVSYFSPYQNPPAGKAADPQSDGSKLPKLFQPLKLRGLNLQNRIGVSTVSLEKYILSLYWTFFFYNKKNEYTMLTVVSFPLFVNIRHKMDILRIGTWLISEALRRGAPVLP